MATGNFFKHWPTMLLGLVVAAILLVAVFSYQLNQTESAVVTTFGRPTEVTEPGLHFRWPFPFRNLRGKRIGQHYRPANQPFDSFVFHCFLLFLIIPYVLF